MLLLFFLQNQNLDICFSDSGHVIRETLLGGDLLFIPSVGIFLPNI